jgi:hypothetical protein
MVVNVCAPSAAAARIAAMMPNDMVLEVMTRISLPFGGQAPYCLPKFQFKKVMSKEKICALNLG